MERELVSQLPRNPESSRKYQSTRKSQSTRLTQTVDDFSPSQRLVVKSEFPQIIQKDIKYTREVRSGPGLMHNWRTASGRKMRMRKRKSRKMRTRMRRRKSRKMRTGMRKI